MAEDEDRLWHAATRDIRPLPKTPVPPGLKVVQRRQPLQTGITQTTSSSLPVSGGGNSLDRRTDERLRRGELPVEARLDLHFMNQSQGQAALRDFISRSAARGLRCVLIITGKGAATTRNEATWAVDWTVARPGILRDRLPEWLGDAAIAPLVLRYYPARPRHGGDGAFYILLRRWR